MAASSRCLIISLWLLAISGQQGYSCPLTETKPGTYILTESSKKNVTSPRQGDITALYPPNQHCAWTFRAPISYVLKLTMTKLDIEDHSNCLHDSLKFYDGGNADNNKLHYNFCGLDQPAFVFYSSGSVTHVVFRSDQSKNWKGFKFQLEVVHNNVQAIACGFSRPAHLFTPDGNVSSPGHLNHMSYPPRANCSWVVDVTRLKVVNVKFSVLKLGCTTHNINLTCGLLRLHDGHSLNAPLIKQYSGYDTSMVTTNLASGGRFITINLLGYRLVQQTVGFNLDFKGLNITEAACSSAGVTLSQTGDFVGPSLSTTRQFCRWSISAPQGTAVYIAFLSNSLSGNCLDNLHIYEGNMTHRFQYRSLCTQTVNEEVGPLGNKVIVELEGKAVTLAGFGARIQHNRSQDLACTPGKTPLTLRSVSGEILLTGEGSPYPCEWRIEAPVNHIIYLTLKEITSDCSDFSHIEISESANGISEFKPLMRLCKHDKLDEDTINSGVRFMKIKLPIQGMVKFHMTYSMINITERACSTRETDHPPVMDAVIGGFSSPGYGTGAYSTNARCFWRIQIQRSDQFIQVWFEEFEMRPMDKSVCEDRVVIYDGGTVHHKTIGPFCGNSRPSLLKGNFSSMLVEFKTGSNSWPRYKGFWLKYNLTSVTASARQACGIQKPAVITSAPGFITSQNYPDNYEPKSDCHWMIRAPLGKATTLRFVDFDVEDNFQCTFDYLVVQETDPSSAHTRLVGRFCGRHPPASVRSTASQLDLHFFSDGSTQKRGFKIEYDFTTLSDVACSDLLRPAVLQQGAGLIEAPDFNGGTYPGQALCDWSINGTMDEVVTLKFVEFSTEESPGCMRDGLTVYNGEVATSQYLLDTFCGIVLPPDVTSGMHGLFLRFKSASPGYGDRFRAHFVKINKTEQACSVTPGVFRTSTEGYISSPNYGNGLYPPNSMCRWVITVPKRQSGKKVVQVIFKSLQLERHSKCHYDAIEFYNAGCNGLIKRLCKDDNYHEPIYSSNEEMCVIFRSDDNENANGFVFNYRFTEPPPPSVLKIVLTSVFGVLAGLILVIIAITCFVKRDQIRAAHARSVERRRAFRQAREQGRSRTVTSDENVPPPYNDVGIFNDGHNIDGLPNLPSYYELEILPKPPEYSSIYPVPADIPEPSTTEQNNIYETVDIRSNSGVIGNAALLGVVEQYVRQRSQETRQDNPVRDSHRGMHITANPITSIAVPDAGGNSSNSQPPPPPYSPRMYVARRVARHATQQVPQRLTERSTERSPRRPTERSGQSPIERSPQRPMDRSPQRPAVTSGQRPIERSPQRPMDRSPNRPAVTSAQRQTERSGQRPIERRSPQRPMDRSHQRPVATSAHRPMQRSPQRPMDRSPQRSVATSAQRPMQRPSQINRSPQVQTPRISQTSTERSPTSRVQRSPQRPMDRSLTGHVPRSPRGVINGSPQASQHISPRRQSLEQNEIQQTQNQNQMSLDPQVDNSNTDQRRRNSVETDTLDPSTQLHTEVGISRPRSPAWPTSGERSAPTRSSHSDQQTSDQPNQRQMVQETGQTTIPQARGLTQARSVEHLSCQNKRFASEDIISTGATRSASSRDLHIVQEPDKQVRDLRQISLQDNQEAYKESDT